MARDPDENDDVPGWVRIVGADWVRDNGMGLFSRLVPLGAVLFTGSLILLMLVRPTRGTTEPVIGGSGVASPIGVDLAVVGGVGVLAGAICAVVGYKLGTAADALTED